MPLSGNFNRECLNPTARQWLISLCQNVHKMMHQLRSWGFAISLKPHRKISEELQRRNWRIWQSNDCFEWRGMNINTFFGGGVLFCKFLLKHTTNSRGHCYIGVAYLKKPLTDRGGPWPSWGHRLTGRHAVHPQDHCSHLGRSQTHTETVPQHQTTA